MKKIGKVFLVGAGPGDPGLITKRGYDLLEQADVVVVDALVNPALLRTLKAQIIYAGKRGPGAPKGSHLSFPQAVINQLLVRLAKQGKHVVRLKGGDPFVFGRGSEELEALVEAHVRFEVVPGVTSATAAPAYAGVPITDRRWASQVTILTGQEGKDEKHGALGVDWKNISSRGTLVILMGVHNWRRIRERLLNEKWTRSKPVVAIESASTRHQRILYTTLWNSLQDFTDEKLVAPATIVIGDVVKLGPLLNWVSREKPLLGKRVVVTRPLEQSVDLVQMLKEKGAEVLVVPTIRIESIGESPAVKRAKRRLRKTPSYYDGIIFLSVNAVKTFTPGTFPKKIPVVAVGPKTKQVALEHGWNVRKIARAFNSVGLVKILGSVRGKRFLLPRVENAPQELIKKLKARGASVDEVITYRSLPHPLTREMKQELLQGVDAVTFTSASTVRNLLQSLTTAEKAQIFEHTSVISIGPQTTAELRRFGISGVAQAKNATLEKLIEVLEKNI